MASDGTIDPRLQRLEILRTKLRARSGNPSYKENCADIRKEISRLEGLIAFQGKSDGDGDS